MIIEFPCDLGERVFHLERHHLKYKKEPYYVIIDCEVSAIHIGRSLKNAGSSYIKLKSRNTGYMSCHISFEDFKNNCFKSYKEAESEMKRRIDKEADTHRNT